MSLSGENLRWDFEQNDKMYVYYLASQGEKGQVRGSSLARMTVQRIFFAHCNLHPIQLLILAEEIRHTD